jgi:hypothetical protein
MGKVIFISQREGGKLEILDPNSNNLTKEAIMALPKVSKDNCITWGGWIHAFWCIENTLVGVPMGKRRRPTFVVERYDAYND